LSLRNWKKILIGLLILGIAGAGVAVYLFNKKVADVKAESPDMELSAAALVEAFNTNEELANRKYVGKIILVSGSIGELRTDDSGNPTVVLSAGDPLSMVTCSFYQDQAASVKVLQPGSQIKIKGVCTGKLIDVVLNKCSIGN